MPLIKMIRSTTESFFVCIKPDSYSIPELEIEVKKLDHFKLNFDTLLFLTKKEQNKFFYTFIGSTKVDFSTDCEIKEFSLGKLVGYENFIYYATTNKYHVALPDCVMVPLFVDQDSQ